MKYLQPHKLKPLNQDILVISVYILDYLKSQKNQIAKLNELLNYLKQKLNITEKKFIYGLNFLYSFQKIYYHKNNDSIGIQ